MALLASLVGCAGEAPEVLPPAPAPFQPQAIEVRLGSSDSSVTIMTAQGGRHTLDGEAFASGGEVTAANGAVYVLKLAEGTWTATFSPPDPVELPLGTSGSSVVIERSEDGSDVVGELQLGDGATVTAANGGSYELSKDESGMWTATFVEPTFSVALGASGDTVVIRIREDGSHGIGGRTVVDGSIVEAANGSSYQLSLSADGNWTAVFAKRDPVAVTLGTSGSSMEIELAEDGRYLIGQREVADGDAVTASNGNRYELSLSQAGEWTATYKPEVTTVALGNEGGMAAIVQEEDGSHSLDGHAVKSGAIMLGANGMEYQLSLGPDGEWTAAYQAETQAMPLGTSGFFSLRRSEAGAWFAGEELIENGATVTAENGSSYQLRLRNGYWSAEFVPESARIAGTGLTATRREDGRGYRVGTSALLPASGIGDVEVDGTKYHVWTGRGRLRGARFDAAPHGKDPGGANYTVGLASGAPHLLDDDDETEANEEGTALVVGGGTFPIRDVLDKGESSVNGPVIVSEARGEIKGIRESAAVLIDLFADDNGAAVQTELRRLWGRVRGAIASVFGSNAVTLPSTVTVENALKNFDKLLDALATEEAFVAATSEDGGGVFEEAELLEEDAVKAFKAQAFKSAGVFGTTGDTRYGAVWTKARNRGIAVRGTSLRADGSDLGAFAYSTIPDTLRIRHIEDLGIAVYRGGTTAVSGDGTLYTGDIELEVRFADEAVSGLITGLTDKDGEAWVYTHSPVDAIALPEARLEYDADWTARLSNANQAWIFYQGKFARWDLARASFTGHLLGLDEEAGRQTVGVWSIGRPHQKEGHIVGGFGAERIKDPLVGGRDDRRRQRPQREAETLAVPAGTEIDGGVLTLRGTLLGPNLNTTGTIEDWDDETQQLDGGRRIGDDYRIPLAEALARQGSERTYSGRNLISLAREEIAGLREELVAVTALGDETEISLQLRSDIWEKVNERVRARLFGTADNALRGMDYLNDPSVPSDDTHKWSSGYPVSGTGTPRDNRALEAMDKVLEALASEDALQDAIKADGNGVFTREDGEPFRPAGPGKIGDAWNRAEGRIKLWLGSTEYTRFGAWRKQTAPNAWSDYKDRLENNENGPNAFAFSPLPQASYEDQLFPVGGTATYTGETVAVQGKTFYSGACDLVVEWHPTVMGGDEVGRLDAVATGLESEGGAPLSYATQGIEGSVGEIIFAAIDVRVDSKSRLHFSDDDPVDLRIGLESIGSDDVRLSGDPTVAASIEGKFVGRTVGGPRAVIGTWDLRSNGDDAKIGTGDRIYGAFGAELRP